VTYDCDASCHPPTLLRAPAPATADAAEEPDVWFAPLRVWEVKGADLTLSPVHAAAAGEHCSCRSVVRANAEGRRRSW
jgi:ATP-dependent DNA ligase